MFDVVVDCLVLVVTSGRHKVISWRYQISAELTLILRRTEISSLGCSCNQQSTTTLSLLKSIFQFSYEWSSLLMIHSTWWLIVNCKWMTSPYNCGWKCSVMFRDEYLKQTGACLPRIDCQYTTATHGSLHDNSSFYSAAGYTFKKNNEHKNLWVAAILQWQVPFTEKAPTSTFSWLKVPTSAFTRH